MQDEITIKIIQAMRINLTEGEQARHWFKYRGHTPNLQALDKNWQGIGFMWRGTKEGNSTARQLYEEAIALDPNYVWPYVNLGFAHFWDARSGWSESPARSLQRAFELAQKALSIDDSIDLAHSLLGSIYAMMGHYDKAIAEAERAVALNPNGAMAYTYLAGIVGGAGRWEESVLHAEQSSGSTPSPGIIGYWVVRIS